MNSSGRRRPAGKVEKSFIPVNGARQGMFIAGPGHGSPVLLYLHGGFPEYFLERQQPTGLDQVFNVVWWEQRGSGISYQPGAAAAAITAEQLIADTLAVSDYLRRRFEQQKIYLMAHSGGTFVGIQAAARAPDFYHAYIGVAQISAQLQSEVGAYQYMLAECEKRGYARLLRRLRKCPVTSEHGTPRAYLRMRDLAMHRLGVGTTHAMRSVITGVFLPSLRCGAYSPGEKVKLWAAKARWGPSVIWDVMLATDLRREVSAVGVPVYFFHGVHDYTCSYGLARTYFEELAAPAKGFYSFQDSAHSPIFEEPGRLQLIMREDVLRGTMKLADGALTASEADAGPVSDR